jgi:uncharacterized protein YcgI (DUF1989 family)
MGQVVTIGLDIAKSVFQVHGVDAAGVLYTPRYRPGLRVELLAEERLVMGFGAQID